MPDARQYAPATMRNRAALAEVMARVLGERGTLLELASGTGEHAVFIRPQLGDWTWQPSDPNPASRASTDAWRAHAGDTRVLPALDIDTTADPWPLPPDARFDAMLCVNMVHISPFETTVGLMRGAGAHLREGGVLLTYGPYRVDGAHTAPSNASFEAWLEAKDPRYGVRDVADLTREAEPHGLRLEERVAMPANNFVLVFRR